MNNWSIGKKSYALSAALVLIILLVGGVSFYGNQQVVSKFNDFINGEFTVVKGAIILENTKDGLHASVYKAIYFSNKNEVELKNEIDLKFKSYLAEMPKQIASFDENKVSAEIKDAVQKIRPETEKYAKLAEEIISFSVAGKKDQVEVKLSEFNKVYSSISDQLKVIKDLANKNIQSSKASYEHSNGFYKGINMLLIAFGFVFGSVLSFVFVKFMLQTFHSVIGQMKESNVKLIAESSEGAELAKELNVAAAEQASNLQQTMASIEEISAMVSQNSQSANKLKEASDVNKQNSLEGTQSVREMVNAIEEIKITNEEILTQMQESNKEFQKIVNIISEIGTKTNVINEIVFQTKLLSFNASVEAARAGEHGKGFAVVASEVGNLAQMSGNAAKEITDMLSESIQRVNTIVESSKSKADRLLEAGKEKIAFGLLTAEKCDESLGKIAENVKTVTVMIDEVAHASKEQAQGVHEINRAIIQLDRLAQQNSTVAQKTSTQAGRLNSETSILSGAVEKLINFVNGRVKPTTKAKPIETKLSKPIAKPLSKPIAKPNDKVVLISEIRKNKKVASPLKSSAKPTPSSSSSSSSSSSKAKPPLVVAKKSVRSNVVPSFDDPNFEEF